MWLSSLCGSALFSLSYLAQLTTKWLIGESSTGRNLEMTDWVLQSDLTSPYLLQQLLFFSPAGYTEKGGQEGRIQPVALSAMCCISVIRTVSPRSESAQKQQKYDRNWQWEQPISFQFCFLPTPGWVDCFLNEWEKAQVNLTVADTFTGGDGTSLLDHFPH